MADVEDTLATVCCLQDFGFFILWSPVSVSFPGFLLLDPRPSLKVNLISKTQPFGRDLTK